MRENEAIKILKNNFPKNCKIIDGKYKGGFDDTDCDFGKALLLAISSLEKIQQYRAIGTIEECQNAMEKQKAKEPDIWGDGYDDKGVMIYDMYDCPNCGNTYELDYDHYTYCPNCGQHMNHQSGVINHE